MIDVLLEKKQNTIKKRILWKRTRQELTDLSIEQREIYNTVLIMVLGSTAPLREKKSKQITWDSQSLHQLNTLRPASHS